MQISVSPLFENDVNATPTLKKENEFEITGEKEDKFLEKEKEKKRGCVMINMQMKINKLYKNQTRKKSNSN